MNKTAIKNFAIWARRKLISDITYKAGMLGVTENGIAEPLAQSTRDLQFFDIGTKDYAEVSGVAIEQRNALVKVIRAKEQGTGYKTAFRNVVEEVAYTWFNRLIAVRFMEVNDYLPSHLRVLSSENEGKLEPDFVTSPFDTDLEFSAYEKDRVYQLKDENKLDELFRMLFIKQCNKLSEILPGLFEQISDYTELLLNISFTDKDGIVYHLTHDISEDEFNVEKEGQVEIIGWMYQYYNTEPKDEVFALLKKNVKITKERIPAATQLFTPDWIVRYMVENSLGRLWVEGHPNESLKGNWKYYLEEAEQEPDVVEQLKKIRDEYAKLSPTDIKVIDPCMGSGHILVYAFDVLMQIYTSQGYVERDAAKSILQNNLFGIDIDVRAYQLAYFAVMMKARQYNRKILNEEIRPNLIAIRNPRDISVSVLKKLGGLEPVGLRLVEEFEDAEEYGSILQPSITLEELDRLDQRLEEIREEAVSGDLLERTETVDCLKLMKPLMKQARLLVQKYDVVVTNPPYRGLTEVSSKLQNYSLNHYPLSKTDLYSVFIEKCISFSKFDKFVSMITQQSWLSLPSFISLRIKVLNNQNVVNMTVLGARAFDEIGGEIVSPVIFVLRNKFVHEFTGVYVDLQSGENEDNKKKLFLSGEYRYSTKQEYFELAPNNVVVFNASRSALSRFQIDSPLKNFVVAKPGMQTSDNERFLRLWFEIGFYKIGFELSHDQAAVSEYKWFPYNKGIGFRKWYGNNDYVVNYYHDGEELKHWLVNNPKDPKTKHWSRNMRNYNSYFCEGITFTAIGNSFSARLNGKGYLFDTKGPMMFGHDLVCVCGFVNSKVFDFYNKMLCKQLTKTFDSVNLVPYQQLEGSMYNRAVDLVQSCVNLSKFDWNSVETSWDFKVHPLLKYRMMHRMYREENGGFIEDVAYSLSDTFDVWQDVCQKRFDELKANEEELNRIFIDIYGLQDELTPDVADKVVTVRKADLGRDIRSLISYAVGCMFGRYSLDAPGLILAGQGYREKYAYASVRLAGTGITGSSSLGSVRGDCYLIRGKNDLVRCSFSPDADNCIPITDEEYFADDIVGRFVEFIRAAYGGETLEENLDFIAKALGNKGNTSRDVIRNYFLNDFYKDHLKIYQKRPIYWLFDSGKQNGFKALVYMHRWNADTVGNLRIEYLHKMQTVYEHEIENCQEMIDHGSGRDVVTATRRKEKLVKQLKECKDYDTLVAHIAFSKIDIDLDDGVKVNYRKVQTGADGKFCEILADSKDIMVKEK